MNKLRLICIPLLLAVPFATQGASFDCAKALSPVETAICASPEVSVLDGTLGQAFATALKNHADKAVILKLDEQHWLAERDDFAWAFLTSRLTKELPEMLAVIYQERIAFLRGLDAPSTSKPLDIILSAIVSSSVASTTPNHDLLESLAKRGAPITLAKEVEIGEPARFRLHPDAKLAADMEEIGDGITDRELPAWFVRQFDVHDSRIVSVLERSSLSHRRYGGRVAGGAHDMERRRLHVCASPCANR